MIVTDHPVWPEYKAALERLARASVRMEAARVMNCPASREAEQAFNDAMAAYDAVRKQLAEPARGHLDGAPVLRAWLGSTELVMRGPAVNPMEARDSQQG